LDFYNWWNKSSSRHVAARTQYSDSHCRSVFVLNMYLLSREVLNMYLLSREVLNMYLLSREVLNMYLLSREVLNMYLLSREAPHVNFIVFSLTRPCLKHMIYSTRSEQANHYNNDAMIMHMTIYCFTCADCSCKCKSVIVCCCRWNQFFFQPSRSLL
jgi:hypothetical protein